jgi:hypothetical protein
VFTPEDFIDAVEEGKPHIQILSHLDFTGFAVKSVGNENKNNATVVVGSSVRSITVRARQCLRIPSGLLGA